MKFSRFCFVCHPADNGDEEIRTLDPLLARQVLSQLSYIPLSLMGLSGLEPPTSRLSGVRSNRLSYKPISFFDSGSHLLSHAVSSIVPSAGCVLTLVFGMGTRVPHSRIAARNSYVVFPGKNRFDQEKQAIAVLLHSFDFSLG